MRALLLLSLALLTCLPCVYGQTPKPALPAPPQPPAATAGTDTLAHWLQAAYPEPEARLKAAYAWVVTHLRYDHESAYEFTRLEPDASHRADSALAARQDVCAGIAALFEMLCRKAGLEAYAVSGYARQQGYVGHAWVAVRSQEGYFLYDPTWDINQREQPQTAGLPWSYFKKAPETFLRTHMPFDPLWQLSAAPISYQDFEAGRFKPATPPPAPFAFADSIASYAQQSELERMQTAYRRMSRYKANNYAVTAYGQMLKNNIQVMKANRLAAVVDSGVVRQNAFVADFNVYVKHFNRRFDDVPSDAYLKNLMARMRHDLDASDAYYAQAATMTNQPAQLANIGTNRQNVAENSIRLREHEAFVTAYLAKGKMGRAFLWTSGQVPR